MRAQLLHLSGPLRGHTDTYPTDEVLLGTDSHADARFPEATPGIADRHAVIRFQPSACCFHLRALDGRVFVNEKEVIEVILEPDDLIELGVDGPKARFRIHVEPGEFCKPVRKMLQDASEVGQQSGVFAFGFAFARDLLTHASTTLKVGFPIAVIAFAFGASYLGSRFGGSTPTMELRRSYEEELAKIRSESVEAQKQQGQLRKEFEQRAKIVDRLAQADEALRRVLDVHANGVCLLAGAFGFERKKNGKVEIVHGDDGEPLQAEYTGSGFLVSATGDVLTNHHVVEPWWHNKDVEPMLKAGFTPKLLHLNAYFPGREPVSIDPATVRLRQDDVDVAALRVDIKDVPIVPISSEDPKQLRGQRVLVLGYPTGVSALLAKTDASLALQITSSAHGLGDVLKELVKNHAITPLATQGSLNDVLDKQLVYDANTTHGGSGGPVFGPDGKVIGVNFAILEGFSGSNFGVPIRFAEELLPK